MNADEMTNTIVRNRWRQSFSIPRYTPAKWFECDAFEVTKAGYFREYEIKTSRSDFFKDAEKEGRPDWNGPTVTKHSRLLKADPLGPVQFWFVVPEGLVKLNEVPEWAGLIELRAASYGSFHYETERIKAPRLHSAKLADGVRQHAIGVCYYRYMGYQAMKSTAVKQAKLLRAFGWPKVKPVETVA